MKRIHVVAAVIRGTNVGRDGQILLAKRPDHLHQGGKWEFPGGKVEQGENVTVALVRELLEELGITPTQFAPLIQIHHDYPDKSIFLDVWEVLEFEGEPQGMEGQLIEWAPASQLTEYEFPAANVPIVAAAMLPGSYWITPEPKGDDTSFLSLLEERLLQGVRLVQYRVKSQDSAVVVRLFEEVSRRCLERDVSLFVNSDTFCVLREAFGDKLMPMFKGIHLTSQHVQEPIEIPESLVLAASCHSGEEIEMAVELGCQFATLSPIRQTSSHPEKTPLDADQVDLWVKKAKLPIYALGGMSDSNRQLVKQRGFQGVAGIQQVGLKGS